MQPDGKINIDVISKAPDELQEPRKLDEKEVGRLFELINELSDDNARLQAENERLSEKANLDVIKRKLIEPYAKNVFRFLVCYSTVVGVILLLNGFSVGGFSLDNIVLSVLTGSTALSAISLVGIVVKGLFK